MPMGLTSLSQQSKASSTRPAGRTGDGRRLTCLRLGEALIPPWDRMWPFRAGRLLNSFRQMGHSLFLASNCSPNTPLAWPLFTRRAKGRRYTCWKRSKKSHPPRARCIHPLLSNPFPTYSILIPFGEQCPLYR